MELNISRTAEGEAEEILSIQKRAFSEELELYRDFKTSPATEPIKKLIYKINKNLHYTIRLDGKTIGGAELRPDSETECYINRIFLIPEYQNMGYGTKIMEHFHKEFPKVKKWTLCTPYKSYRNHWFYEKLGYVKVGEQKVNDSLILFKYERLLDNDK